MLYADEQATIGRVPLPKGCEHPSAERRSTRMRGYGESGLPRVAGAILPLLLLETMMLIELGASLSI